MHWRLLSFLSVTLTLFPVMASTMIAGGKAVAVSEEIAKTQVLLQTYDKDGYLYTCGATVISRNLVLTARHCFYDMVRAELVFSVNRYKANKTQIRPGTKLLDEPSKQSDIVILKFAGTLPKEYKIASLGETGIKMKNGLDATATGYAATKTNGNDNGILRKLETKVLEFNDTVIHLPGPASPVTTADYRGLIKGDSGGALYAKDTEGNLRVIGIHSDAIYEHEVTRSVRVKAFLPWIKKTISEN